MSSFHSRPDAPLRATSDTDSNIPATCPACGSASITTTAKSPDENSYWRCNGCGEIWNVGRRHDVRSGTNRWR